MICPSCGHANPPDSRFCLECGQALGVRCPRCGAELPAAAKFCNRCGHRSAEPRTEAPSPEPAVPTSFLSGRYQVQRFLDEEAKKDLTQSASELRFGAPREVALKAISETQRLFPVEWQ